MSSECPDTAAASLVSVVMPVRNGAHAVAAQVQALVAQTYERDWELIVVDNGSTDGSAAIIRAELAGSHAPRLVRAEVVRFVGRFGYASPRNHGVAMSVGSWLAFCDADDVVAPDWLAELVSCRRPGTITASRFVAVWEGATPNDGRPADDDSTAHLFGVPVVHAGGMLIQRADFAVLGGFDTDFDAGGEDADFSIRAFGGGMKTAVAPAAFYGLRNRCTTGSAIGQSYRNGRSRVMLFARHCDVLAEPPADWGLLFRRMRDVVRRSPELLVAPRRTPYLRMVAGISARVIWSVRLRVRYF